MSHVRISKMFSLTSMYGKTFTKGCEAELGKERPKSLV